MVKNVESKHRSGRYREIVFCIIFVTIAFVISDLSDIVATYNRWDISSNWIETSAKVLKADNYKRKQIHSKKDAYEYSSMDLTLQYQVENQVYITDCPAEQIHVMLSANDVVNIYVNPENIEDVWIAGVVDEYKIVAGMYLAGLILLLVLSVIFGRKIKKQQNN